MIDQCCRICKHYQPERGPTGRVLPSRGGTCEYPVVWPTVWPEAYLARGRDVPYDMPRRFQVWPGSGTQCKCFEKGKP